MLRYASRRRVVYETIPTAAWVIFLVLGFFGMTCVFAEGPVPAEAGYKTFAIAMLPLLLRRRIDFERQSRQLSVHLVISLVPLLPALNLRLLATTNVDMVDAVVVSSYTFSDGHHLTTERQSTKEHSVRLARESNGPELTGLAGDPGLLRRYSALAGRTRALAFASRLAEDLGLPLRE